MQAQINNNITNVINYNQYNQNQSQNNQFQMEEPTAPPLYPDLNEKYSYYPPRPPITQTIHNATLSLLSQAADVASSVLGEKNPDLDTYYSQYTPQFTPKQAPTTYNFDFSNRSWNMFNSETHVNHGEESGKKDDTGTRVLVGLIGLVAAGVTAFFIGKAIAQGEEAEAEKKSFKDLKNCWESNKCCYEADHADYQAVVDDIVLKTDTLLQRNQTNRIHKIALLVFGFIGGGTAVAGAIIGSGALMATAVAIGSIVSVAALFKLGYACFSTRDQKDAQAIESDLATLSRMQVIVV